jgi:ribosomal protein L2
MPSGEMRNVLDVCMATIGTTSNADHMNESVGKGWSQALERCKDPVPVPLQ